MVHYGAQSRQRTSTALTLLSIAAAAVVLAQDTPTFQTGVSLIHLDAGVLGQNGRPLTGLQKEDFSLFDEGAQQDVVGLSEGEQPLDIVLLFDTSGSMHGQVKKVAEVASEGLRQLRRGDRVSVMVFTMKAKVIAPFTNDPEAVQQAIDRVTALRFRGGTFIQDAVGEAAKQFTLERNRDRRRAVLVITDDFGRPARHKTAIIENLWEADALVCGLIVENRLLTKLFGRRGQTPPGGVEPLAAETGGDVIHSDDLSASFPEMMHRIRSFYTLYYKVPNGKPGSLRKIDVQLSAQASSRFAGARVIARRAYRLRERDQYGFASR